jgi:hypothetical protein
MKYKDDRQIMNGLVFSVILKVKALLRKNVLDDVTAAPFSVGFFQLAAEKKTLKTVQL